MTPGGTTQSDGQGRQACHRHQMFALTVPNTSSGRMQQIIPRGAGTAAAGLMGVMSASMRKLEGALNSGLSWAVRPCEATAAPVPAAAGPAGPGLAVAWSASSADGSPCSEPAWPTAAGNASTRVPWACSALTACAVAGGPGCRLRCRVTAAETAGLPTRNPGKAPRLAMAAAAGPGDGLIGSSSRLNPEAGTLFRLATALSLAPGWAAGAWHAVAATEEPEPSSDLRGTVVGAPLPA